MTGKKKMRKRAENKMKALIEKEVERSCFFFLIGIHSMQG